MNNNNKNRPSYKKTPIVRIPAEWRISACNSFSKLTAGGTPSTRHPEYWNGDIPWMSSGELNLKRVYVVEGRITDLGMKNSSTKLIPKHSVLVGLAGQGKTRGTVAVNELELCTNQSVAAIIPDRNQVHYLYLFYNLDNRYDELRRLSTGDGGRGGLNLNILGLLQIPLPPLPEQKKIAEILSVWDDAIANLAKLIEEKKKLKKGLMQRLFNHGTHRIHGREWRKVRLRDVFIILKRKNEKGCTRVLTASGQHGLVDQRDFFNRSVAGQNLEGYFHLKRGDFAYNRSLMNGYPYGAIKRLNDYDEGVVSVLYLCFSLNSEDGDSDYFAHFFESGHLNSELREIVQVGARAHGLLNVSNDDFMNIKFYMPSLEEQKHIAEILNTADLDIGLLEEKLYLLKEQKKGLMQKLLTGAIRVRMEKNG